MARPAQTEIRLRLVVENPVPGVLHALQDKGGHPVDPQLAGTAPLVFEFPVRVADGPKFFGDHVRPEGPVRRFFYVAIGEAAGQPGSPWRRRMKIDIHDIPPPLVAAAKAGAVLQAVIAGAGADGSPAAATVRLTRPWSITGPA